MLLGNPKISTSFEFHRAIGLWPLIPSNRDSLLLAQCLGIFFQGSFHSIGNSNLPPQSTSNQQFTHIQRNDKHMNTPNSSIQCVQEKTNSMLTEHCEYAEPSSSFPRSHSFILLQPLNLKRSAIPQTEANDGQIAMKYQQTPYSLICIFLS